MKCTFFLVIALMFSNFSYTQTTYISQGDGSYNGAGCNWLPSCPPSPIPSGDKVIINHVITGSNIKISSGGELENNGTLTLSGEVHIDGLFTNVGTADVFKVHNDGELCNSGTLTLDPGQKFDNHGGIIGCGGTINACDWKIHDNGGTVSDISNSTLCCGVAMDPGFPTGEPGVDYSTIDICSLLPVTLVKFGLENKIDEVSLYWETKSESNNDYFLILRSRNGVDFKEVGTVQGMGNTTNSVNYEFIDKKPVMGISYYKLRQVDFDGEYVDSEIIRTDFISGSEFSMYPNPANSSINLLIVQENENDVLIECIDIFGKVVFRSNHNLFGGINLIPLDIENLANGMYLCRVTFAQGKVMKNTFRKYR